MTGKKQSNRPFSFFQSKKHQKAPINVKLIIRKEKRMGGGGEIMNYEQVLSSETEKLIIRHRLHADVIDGFNNVFNDSAT